MAYPITGLAHPKVVCKDGELWNVGKKPPKGNPEQRTKAMTPPGTGANRYNTSPCAVMCNGQIYLFWIDGQSFATRCARLTDDSWMNSCVTTRLVELGDLEGEEVHGLGSFQLQNPRRRRRCTMELGDTRLLC